LRAAHSVALALLLAFVFGDPLSAHRRDEYLQAARIAVDPNRLDVELDLTPGMDVAEGIIATIDRDRDGTLSDDERREYVDRAVASLGLAVDGQSLPMQRAAATFPDTDALRRGEGTIELRLRATLPPLHDGPHALRFRNGHAPAPSVYLANALVPASRRIAVTGQHRDAMQTELTIDFVMRPASPVPPLWLMTMLAGAAGLAARLGRRQ
jgi:hypothetical protein